MADVTRILSAIEQGDPSAAEQLLPLVYDELRKLATARMAEEKPGQTIQATALVHEAYLRLVDNEKARQWNGRGHFFGAAAEAMRRILVETARQKRREKHGGDWNRVELRELDVGHSLQIEEMLALSDLIDKLAEHDRPAAELVKLRCFAGFSVEQAAEMLELSRTSAYRQWTYARAWLYSRIGDDRQSS